jgi:hypothetical protein
LDVSSPLSPQSSSELEILGLDGDSLGVDGAQVRVFEERDEVGFRGFLEGHDSAEQGKKRKRKARGKVRLCRAGQDELRVCGKTHEDWKRRSVLKS